MTEKPKKAYKGIALEGWIAKWYAAGTGKNKEDFRALARKISDELPAGSRVLEVAPGPGYLAIELAKAGYAVTGLDISETFVKIAREGAAREAVTVDFRLGNASSMPLESNLFDFVVCRAAFKNFTDPEGALNEMYRVLRPEGRLLIGDMRKDATKAEIDRLVGTMQLGPLSSLSTRLSLRMLLRRAYTEPQLRALVAGTPFGGFEMHTAGIGFELRLAK